MKLEELFESITLVPAVFDKETNSYHSPTRTVMKDCPYCDGSGHDLYNENRVCDDCNGTKIYRDEEFVAPSLNMANAAAGELFAALGMQVNWDDGLIRNKDLPKIKRRLIELKNSASVRQKHTYDSYEEDRGQPQRYVDRSGEVPEIKTKHNGPRIFHFGMPEERLMRYIDTMIQIVDYAQKNGCDITYG